MSNRNPEKQYEFDSICGHVRHGRIEQAKKIHNSLTDDEKDEMHVYFINELNDSQLSFDVRKKLN